MSKRLAGLLRLILLSKVYCGRIHGIVCNVHVVLCAGMRGDSLLLTSDLW